MGKEIECKFLLKNGDWKHVADSGIEIKQGYLSTEKERTVRVRIRGDKGILTVKGETFGMSRLEYEYEIPVEDARELILLCKNPIIEKKRFLIQDQNLTWEIDIFEGENKGLEIAEVELTDEHQEIKLPDWIGEEVTSDERYYNSNLIKNPFKIWKQLSDMNNLDFKINGLDHIALRVKDLESAADWYQKVLGLKKYEPWGEFPIFLLAGTTGIALFPSNENDIEITRTSKNVGFDHFAFNVSNEDFAKARKKYDALGIEYRFNDHQYFHSIYTFDPDGFEVELTTLMVPSKDFY